MTARLHAARGVSLVEAMVALAVMAIGLLGVVGLQATLRANADVSRQRSEAVRIAQEQLDTLRGYTSLAGASGLSYEGIADLDGEPVATGIANTEFTLHQTVTAAGAGRAKMVELQVAWRDRRAESDNQWVDFATLIAGTPPALAGSLILSPAKTALATPGGRHPAIPPQAQDNGDGSSSFQPGGSGGVSWTFDNLTGVITRTCSVAGVCSSSYAFLLTGYVRFATGQAPSAALAENPPELDDADLASVPAQGFVRVRRVGQSVDDVCVHRADPQPTGPRPRFVVYYCAVPVEVSAGVWSGRSDLHFADPPVAPALRQLASDATDAAPNHLRVCRYSPAQNPTRNSDHPAAYSSVGGALVNQNFLVISAGPATDSTPAGPWTCPADDPQTQVISSTWPHQP
ncbi:prepilin-type N-terminal cleavage/methylation domain-containing protein [Rubrivivax sp. JA1055]|uniref:type IV pilus modification PilV family protein n=1 Tax=Rubrivivax sp. JA1055 TaxID=2894194 RepID=UPI001E470F70|nr:prepilin-type N-terminal cleavage/methylation domain-containing protein [Rubrivivax sp. JA1055]MCC9595344.1 prepilin-type N-terminal cleavage/methylation domain-containing protein [Rubrivivax sp. JA1055]